MTDKFFRMPIILFLFSAILVLSAGGFIFYRVQRLGSEIPLASVNQYRYLSAAVSVIYSADKNLALYNLEQSQVREDRLRISINRTISALEGLQREYRENFPQELHSLVEELKRLIEPIERLIDEDDFDYVAGALLSNRLGYAVSDFQTYTVKINNSSLLSLEEQKKQLKLLRQFILYSFFVIFIMLLIMLFLLIFQYRLMKIVKTSEQKALEASRVKSEFLANMSHEIRTPLNAVSGMLYLLNRTHLDDRQRDYTGKAYNSAQTLLGILNDILDFSKIEAGRMELDRITININEIFDNLVNLLQEQILQKRLELILQYPFSFPFQLKGDQQRLGQVLINLVNNAVKFTHEGEILVNLNYKIINENKVKLLFSVRDTGIGLTPRQKEKLFVPFSQVDNTITRSYGGSGLGLSICQRLIDQMGGTIDVESVYGEGSTFSFSVLMEYLSIKEEDNKGILLHRLSGLRILIADDHDRARETFKDILVNLSAVVYTAASGEEALNAIKEQPFDLCFIDYILNDMDGYELVQRIKETQPDSAVKYIMTASCGYEEFIEKALNHLFNGFLLKPVTARRLFDSIDQVFNPSIQRKEQDISESSGSGSVLLAEDNEINQQVAREILEWAGFHVDIACNGREAIDMLLEKKNSYDAVLMDLHMPVLNGYDTAREIRAGLSLPDIPIIALTADVVSSVEERVLESGMNDYISKPVNPESLYSILFKWVDKSVRSHMNTISSTPSIPSTPDTEDMLKISIRGLNISEGLRRLNNNGSLYKKLLLKFYQDKDDVLGQLSRCYSRKDWKETHRIVHTQKGVAGNLAAEKLARILSELENCVLQEQWSEFERKHSIMEIEYKRLKRSLKNVAHRFFSVSEPVPFNRKLPSKEELENTLNEISLYITNQEPKECRETLQSLREMPIENPLLELIEKIYPLIQEYRFPEALEIWNAYLIDRKEMNDV